MYFGVQNPPPGCVFDEVVLQLIDRHVAAQQRAVLQGPRRSGTSTTLREWVRRNKDKYDHVLWLSAPNAAVLAAELEAVGHAFGWELPSVAGNLCALARDKKVLIVCDNTSAPQTVAPLTGLPRATVLVTTSCDNDWSMGGVEPLVLMPHKVDSQ